MFKTGPNLKAFADNKLNVTDFKFVFERLILYSTDTHFDASTTDSF